MNTNRTNRIRPIVRDALVSGSVASATSTAALTVLGRLESGSAAAGTNATSHWVWGDEALACDGAEMRHTAVGYVIHHAMSVLWAAVYEALGPLPGRFGRAALVSATALVVDYTVTPRRLTPGFEARLSKISMLLVYAAFAAGLVLGDRMRHR